MTKKKTRRENRMRWDEAGCHRTFGHVLSLFITSYLSVCACRHVSANDLGTKKGVRTSTKQWVCGHIHVCICVTCVKVHTLCVVGVCVNILCVCSLTASMCVCHVRLWTSVRPSVCQNESCVSRCKCVCIQGHCYPCMSSVAVGCDDFTVSSLQEWEAHSWHRPSLSFSHPLPPSLHLYLPTCG